MVDGITLRYTIGTSQDYNAWKQLVNIEFDLTAGADTGEIKTKKREDTITTTYRAKWETIDLQIKEVLNIGTGIKLYHLSFKGSLHKNHYHGKNYKPFTWQHLQQQVQHICNTLHLNPTRVQISSIEIGVNIVTPFIVMPFLMQNIISYKGNSFNRYKADSAGFCLGIYCSLTQYEVKIYDKGKQNSLPYHLMRFEKRVIKMQELNKGGIKYLSDLQNRPKVECLLKMLLEAWEHVLIYDIEPVRLQTKDKLKKREIDLLLNGKNPKYWEELKSKNVRQFNYQREIFRNLNNEFGNNRQKLINELIQNEWQDLFKNCTNLHSGNKINSRQNCTNLPVGKSEKLYEFTIKIKGKIVQKRYCNYCRKDISHQQAGSRFCRDILVGEISTHDCRNNSNNFKYKIAKITGKGILFDFMPFIVKGDRKVSYAICRDGSLLNHKRGIDRHQAKYSNVKPAVIHTGYLF